MSRLKAGPSVQGHGRIGGAGVRAVVFCGLVLATLGIHAQTLPDFTGIVEKNAPTVVHVEAKYTGKNSTRKSGRGADAQGTPDDQMEIFRRFFGMPMVPSPQDQTRTSVGSGFIISPDGYVLTNNHVVDDADEVSVRLQDRRTLTAKVVGTDPQYDIALLKLDAGQLPAVSIGDSRQLKPGQWVLAIGSPFGFDYTVTQGIVSAVGRNLGSGDQPYTSFIQTDVPINRGNSGGPLFNLQGQVVGVNSQIYSNTGGYIGVAFSIPIDVAMNVVQQIKEKGYVSRGMLGVQVQPVDDFVKAMKLPNANGALIGDVGDGSGAEKAGLRQGDVIIAFNGQPINQAADLPPLVGMTKPHSQADVTILRDGKKETVKVTIGEVPRDSSAASLMRGGGQPGAPASAGAAALGLSVQDLGLVQRKQLGIKTGQGVVVTKVTGAAGADAGLQPGDVILAVNRTRVDNTAGFREAAKTIRPGDTAMLLVSRDQITRFVGLTVPDR
jgi:serine protease Do